jgi:hypothetical protein
VTRIVRLVPKRKTICGNVSSFKVVVWSLESELSFVIGLGFGQWSVRFFRHVRMRHGT